MKYPETINYDMQLA